MKKDKSSSGNALFLILIAVALFAALSYAVTSSSRGGGGVSREKLILGAAEIAGYLGMAQQTANRMILAGGAQANQIGLREGYWELWDGTPTFACSSGFNSTQEFDIFDPAGGDAPARSFEEFGASNPGCCGALKSGHLRMMYSDIKGIGSSLQDVVIFVSFMTPAICNEINRREGISTSYTGSEGSIANSLTDFRCSWEGDLDTLAATFGYNPDEAIFEGRPLFCAPLGWNGQKSYTIVKTIVER